jgi:hypothetical protein
LPCVSWDFKVTYLVILVFYEVPEVPHDESLVFSDDLEVMNGTHGQSLVFYDDLEVTYGKVLVFYDISEGPDDEIVVFYDDLEVVNVKIIVFYDVPEGPKGQNLVFFTFSDAKSDVLEHFEVSTVLTGTSQFGVPPPPTS